MSSAPSGRVQWELAVMLAHTGLPVLAFRVPGSPILQVGVFLMRGLRRMRLLMLTMATLAVMPLEAQDTTRVDRMLQEADERFALLTECASVLPVFESEVEEEVQRGDEWESVGLTEAAVRRAVTSRLRAARVYAEVERQGWMASTPPWSSVVCPK